MDVTNPLWVMQEAMAARARRAAFQIVDTDAYCAEIELAHKLAAPLLPYFAEKASPAGVDADDPTDQLAAIRDIVLALAPEAQAKIIEKLKEIK